MTEFELDGLNCLYNIAGNNRKIVYILYPMEILRNWIDTASEHYNTTIVVITGMDWDNDLTPWPEKGVPRGCPAFRGNAPQFLSRLERAVSIIESTLSFNDAERTLAGVSLSGLFTLWQWPQNKLFHNVISLSGSFWYTGFMDWFAKQDYSGKSGTACLLLGDKEADSKVKAFQPVAVNTQEIASRLAASGVTTVFEMVPGNHYAQPIERLNRAMSVIFRHD